MLESIRSGAKSFGVKVIFGLIILVFVFWGIGNYNDRDYTNVVAVVNGEPIVAMEFEKAYSHEEEYLLRTNPGLTREQLAKEHLGRKVLNDLIRATLIAQEAKRAGIVVSPQEMRLAVGQLKAFQDDKGQFDPGAYTRVLAAQRMTPVQYEKDLADELLREKMFALVTAPAWMDPAEPQNRFNFLRERRIIDYAFIPAQNFKDKVTISDNEAKEWYDSHISDFAIPPMVDVAYILVEPGALVDRASISEADARKWYEANKSKFEQPERIHARHILASLPEDADDTAIRDATQKLAKAREQLAAGKKFEDVADAMNGPGAADKGGDLGWLGRGQTIPEFEAAAFILPVGQVSEPVRTPLGLHLILVEEKQKAGIAPFEKVAEEAYKAIAFEEGSEKLHDALDNLIEDNILQKPLEQAAAHYNLKSGHTGLLSKQGLMEKLNLKSDAADSLLSVPAGAPLDTALEAGDNYLIARILESKPADTKSYDTVKKEIIAQLTQQKALELALNDATALLQKIKNEKPDQVHKPELTKSKPLERNGQLAGFEPAPALMAAIFASKPDAWLTAPQVVTTDKNAPGALIAYIDKTLAPEKGEYEAVAEMLDNTGKQERMAGLFGIFIQNLAQKAKVQIVNQDRIDRVNI